MIFCLDTDILIEYFRGNENIKNRITAVSENDNIGVTWLTVYEFFKGIFLSGKLEEARKRYSLKIKKRVKEVSDITSAAC